MENSLFKKKNMQETKQEIPKIKEGVDFVFEQNPELSYFLEDYFLDIEEKTKIISFYRGGIFTKARGKDLYKKYNGSTIPYEYSDKSWNLLLEGIKELGIDKEIVINEQIDRVKKNESTEISQNFDPSTGQFEGFVDESEKQSSIEYVIKNIELLKKFKNLEQKGRELYSDYLNTIFPESKIKDIAFHGTDENFENFKKFVENKNTV